MSHICTPVTFDYLLSILFWPSLPQDSKTHNVSSVLTSNCIFLESLSALVNKKKYFYIPNEMKTHHYCVWLCMEWMSKLVNLGEWRSSADWSLMTLNFVSVWINKHMFSLQSSVAPSAPRTLSWTWALRAVKTLMQLPSSGSGGTVGCWRWRRMMAKKVNLFCEYMSYLFLMIFS